MHLFLSYRRADGEGVTAQIGNALVIRHEHTFRDLVDIQVGEVAQERIDDALAKADVVVFVDTPKAGESDWIAKELAIALGRHVPVLWLKVGRQLR